METFNLFAFDLDDTLAPSKSPIAPECAELLSKLSKDKKIAIISAADINRIKNDVIKPLQKTSANLNNLILLPTAGGQFYIFEDENLKLIYSEELSEYERKNLFEQVDKVFSDLGLNIEKPFGEKYLDSGTQFTYTPLGINCPNDIKKVWDPNREKRLKAKNILDKILPAFEISIGGSSSIDITKKGIDKAYGIKKLIEYTKINTEEIVYFGDKFLEGGNDFPVKSTGVICIEVKDENHTMQFLRNSV